MVKQIAPKGIIKMSLTMWAEGEDEASVTETVVKSHITNFYCEQDADLMIPWGWSEDKAYIPCVAGNTSSTQILLSVQTHISN